LSLRRFCAWWTLVAVDTIVIAAVGKSITVDAIITFVAMPTTPLAVNASRSIIPAAVAKRTISWPWKNATIAAGELHPARNSRCQDHLTDATTNGTTALTIALVLVWTATAKNPTAVLIRAIPDNVASSKNVHATNARAINIDAKPIRATPFLVIYDHARNASLCRPPVATTNRAH
jgi:hypothetical protein